MIDFSVSASLDAVLGAGTPAGSSTHADFELWVGPFTGRDLYVVSFRGREAVSKLFSFDIRVFADISDELLEVGLIGMPATFSMSLSEGVRRVVQGIVASVELDGQGTRGDRRSFRIRVVPKLWLLKKRVTSRIFQEMTVPEIVTRVLDGAGVANSWHLGREYLKRAYCVQYQESDFAFIARILAEEGIFWYFEQPSGALDNLTSGMTSALGGAASVIGSIAGAAADALVLTEKVVFLDNPHAYPAVSEDGTPNLEASVSFSASLGGIAGSVAAGVGLGDSLHLRLREGGSTGLVRANDVPRFSFKRAQKSTSVLLRDYDFRKPMLDMRAEASAGLSVSASASASAGLSAGISGLGSIALDAGASVSGLVTGDLRVYEHRGDCQAREITQPRADTRLEQVRRAVKVGEGESNCRALAPGHRFWLDAEATPALSLEYVTISVSHQGVAPELSNHSSATGGMLETYRNSFECIPATAPARPKVPKRKVINTLESAVVVGPAGEEIYTDEHGRIKVQFHWDLDGARNEFSSCWMRVLQPWAGAAWGSQFIPRIGMEVMVSFLGGDQDCPVALGSVYNATHAPPFLLPRDKTRSGIRTQTTRGGGGFNELSFEDAKAQEQVYLHAQRDWDEVVERNHTSMVKGDEQLKVQGSRMDSVDGDVITRVSGNVESMISGDQNTQLEGNRIDVVTGNSDERVSGMATMRIEGREHRNVTKNADLEYADDLTLRVRGCMTTLVGKYDAQRSYVVHAEGIAKLSSMVSTEISSEKELVLRVGKSWIRITDEKIEIESPAVTAKGAGGGLSVDDEGMKLKSSEDAKFICEKKLLIKTKGASLAMEKEVKIDGEKILLNSPEKANDPPPAEPNPPTAVELVDNRGNPLAYQRFLVVLEDGSEVSGMTDKDGKANLDLKSGGKITFPDLSEVKAG